MPSSRAFVQVGLVAVCASAALIVGVHANDALDFWNQEWARQAAQAPAAAPAFSAHSTQTNARAAPPARSIRRAVSKKTEPARLKLTVRPRSRGDEDSGNGEKHAGLSGQSYCVRACDGYYFPAPGGSADAASCSLACPGAQTELYHLSRGQDSIEQAISEKGKLYAKLATAFAYRTKLQATCSCRSSTRLAGLTELQRDPTLAEGDIVVTDRGAHVFSGSGKLPFKERDFIPFRKVKGLSQEVRTFLSLMERPFDRAELPRGLSRGQKSARTKRRDSVLYAAAAER